MACFMEEPLSQWNHLPVSVLAEIYSYLPLRDRLSASAVCFRWNRAIHSPYLWKCVHVQLNGDSDTALENYDNLWTDLEDADYIDECCLEFSDDRALVFAEIYGKHLKKLHLTCDPQDIDHSKNLQRKIKLFLTKLTKSKCVLKELKVALISFSEIWQNVSKTLTVEAFVEFVKKQNQIKVFLFDSLLFGQDLRLLETLLSGSGKKLEKLCFPFDWERTTKYCKIIENAYYQCMTRMPNLTSMTFNMESVTRHAIALVLNNCPRLNTICLRNFRELKHANSLQATEWMELSLIRPQLQVDCFLKGWIAYTELFTFVPPQVPLRSLLGAFKEDLPPAQYIFADVIDYLTNNFAKTLVLLVIGNSCPFVDIDIQVLNLVQQCFLLSDLTIVANLSMQTLSKLCELQTNKEIDLRPFWLIRSAYTGQENLQLMNLYDLFGDVFEECGWVFK